MNMTLRAGAINRHGVGGRLAFTLIELLVVVGIILILMGISFKLISMTGRKAATAKTLYVLEQTRNALEAYYVAIGTYPPTTAIQWVRPQTLNHFKYDPKISGTTGLCYYIGGPYDDPRKGTWTKFSRPQQGEPVISGFWDPYNIAAAPAGFQATRYTNDIDTIQDGWKHDIHYQPNADYSGYTIWSDGGAGSGRIGIEKNE